MKRYKYLLKESILDIPKDKLCPLLCDEQEQLKPEIKDYIVKTFSDWRETMNANFTFINMILIGG